MRQFFFIQLALSNNKTRIMNSLLLIGSALLAYMLLGKKDKKKLMEETAEPLPETEIPADAPATTVPETNTATTVPETNTATTTTNNNNNNNKVDAYGTSLGDFDDNRTELQKRQDKLVTYVKPIDFTAVIANYKTSEKYADCRYYMRFINNFGPSTKETCVITIKSVYLVLMTYKQKTQIEVVAHPEHVIVCANRTSWVCVSELVNNVWESNTFGAYLFAKYGYDSDKRFYPCTAYITYSVYALSNPSLVSTKTISMQTEVFFDDYLSTGLHDDPLLQGGEYPAGTGRTLAGNIEHYRQAGRPINNDYGG